MDKTIQEIKHQQYNSEPVYYCSQCLSLRVIKIDDEAFCDECGSMDILTDNIEVWEKAYLEKYKEEYLSI